MLGFGPVAGVPLAGSPMQGGYFFMCEAGSYSLQGYDIDNIYHYAINAETIPYNLEFNDDSGVARQFYIYAEPWDHFQISLEDARIYTSSYFYGDSEIIRVTPEVTSIRMRAEPRDMVVYPDPEDMVAKDYDDLSAQPRLRRT